MLSRNANVFFGERPVGSLLHFRKGPNHFGWRTHHQRSRWHDLVFRDERSSRDDTPRPDLRTVHDDGPHPDQHFVADPASVKQGPMATSHVFANVRSQGAGKVHHRPILQVRTAPDPNSLDIGPKDATKPDTRIFSKRHCSKEIRTRSDKGTRMDFRRGFEEGTEGIVHVRAGWAERYPRRLSASITPEMREKRENGPFFDIIRRITALRTRRTAVNNSR